MTKEEIWEKLATEAKLRGFSPASYDTYKANISLFLDWSDKPYEDLDEEDFRNYLIYIINEGRFKPQTINSRNSAIQDAPIRADISNPIQTEVSDHQQKSQKYNRICATLQSPK